MDPSANVDLTYRKILVIGASKTGKTSLLGSATSCDFSRAYRPTSRCTSYYDTQHQLELIDTPGLDDRLLNGTVDTRRPESFDEIKAHYHTFRDDLIVQEMISEPKDDTKTYKDNLLIDVDITQVDAYLIVYTDDERSKRVAKALRLALFSRTINDNRRGVFFLHHIGDFDLPTFITRVLINQETACDREDPTGDPNDPFIEMIFRDDLGIQTKSYHHQSLKYLPHCTAQTGEGVQKMLATLRNELDRMIAASSGKKGAGSSTDAGALLRGKIPTDLFDMTQEQSVRNMAIKPPSAAPKARTQPTARQTQKEANEEDEAPVYVPQNGNQRAQCTSMAAAACTIQ